MLRFLLLKITALLLLSGCTSPQPKETATSTCQFKAMSCNVRYGTARDGDNAWPKRRDHLVSTIVAANVGILGVQEALAFQLDFLAERLPHHRRLGQGRDGGDRGEHSSLFIDERLFEVVDHGDFWLSPTPAVTGSVGWDAALTRMCTWARLRSRATGHELQVWNTHFDHRGKKARHESAKLLARRIEQTPGPHLLLGDLNAGERSTPLAALRAANLRDTFRDMHPDATEVGTGHGFRGGKKGRKIDYVLVGPGLMTLAAAILSDPGPNGRWPSDHHLVTASLEY